jgi:hypothetical protein
VHFKSAIQVIVVTSENLMKKIDCLNVAVTAVGMMNQISPPAYWNMRPNPLGRNVDIFIFILSVEVSRFMVAESILRTSVIPSAPPLYWIANISLLVGECSTMSQSIALVVLSSLREVSTPLAMAILKM